TWVHPEEETPLGLTRYAGNVKLARRTNDDEQADAIRLRTRMLIQEGANLACREFAPAHGIVNVDHGGARHGGARRVVFWRRRLQQVRRRLVWNGHNLGLTDNDGRTRHAKILR